MKTKICIDCKKKKNINKFELRSDSGKYRNQCKKCRNLYGINYRKKNKIRLQKYEHERIKSIKRREYKKEYIKNYYSKPENKQKFHKNYLKRMYNDENYQSQYAIFDSKFEEWFYNEISKIYSNIIIHYKLDRYHYDFYVPSINTIIELQIFWTHGNEPYKYNCLQHNELLKFWENKKSDIYNKAIKTWTIIDPLKRQLCKKNDIKLIELFNKQECNKYLRINL